MNNDRIHEVYYGDPSSAFSQRSRERIHWICSHVEGSRVLDVGCSQGITCLLLGREGFECTGVDIEEAALEHANRELAKEAKPVQDRVEFHLADASRLDFDDASFDTVILGEILEHLTHPARVLREAHRVLKSEGTLVVTVPHGLNSYQDHRSTFYASSLLRLLQPRFDIAALDTTEHYILCVGGKASEPTDSRSPDLVMPRYEQSIRILEDRAVAIERDGLAARTKSAEQIQALRQRIKTADEEVRERQQRCDTEHEEAERLRSRVAEIEQLQAAAEEGLSAQEEEVARLRRAVEAAEEGRASALAQLDRESGLLREQVTTLQQSSVGLQEDAAAKETGLNDRIRALDLFTAERARRVEELEADLANTRALLADQAAEVQRLLAAKDSDYKKQRQSTQLDYARRTAQARRAHAAAVKVKDEAIRQVQRARTTDARIRERELESGLARRDEDWRRRLHEKEQELANIRLQLDQQLARHTQELSDSKILASKRVETAAETVSHALKTKEKEWERARLAERIRDAVRKVAPQRATVLVVSRGDDGLLDLDGRIGWHFPQTSGGVYAGYHPKDSQAAITHLEELRSLGAAFLLIPSTEFWWLKFYEELGAHLRRNFRVVSYQEESCLVFDLRRAVGASPDLALFPMAAKEAGQPSKDSAQIPSSPSVVVRDEPNRALGGDDGSQSASKPPPTHAEVAPGPRSREPAARSTRMPVAAILDEFTAGCLGSECRLVTFRPDNWRETLEKDRPEVVFVESAWHGNDGSWQYRVAKYKKNGSIRVSQRYFGVFRCFSWVI